MKCSHETTYLKKEESRTSALPINVTNVMTPISAKNVYTAFKPINAQQFDITENTEVKSINWQEYRFDLIKSVLPALVQGDNSAENCAKKSIEFADEVIKLLKDEKRRS